MLSVIVLIRSAIAVLNTRSNLVTQCVLNAHWEGFDSPPYLLVRAGTPTPLAAAVALRRPEISKTFKTMVTNLQIAWAAGLFEGEGYITRNGKYPKIGLTMTDKDVVNKFVALFGLGNVRTRERHPCKTQYEWQIVGKQCKVILEQLLPYLGERRAYKALNALDDIEL